MQDDQDEIQTFQNDANMLYRKLDEYFKKNVQNNTTACEVCFFLIKQELNVYCEEFIAFKHEGELYLSSNDDNFWEKFYIFVDFLNKSKTIGTYILLLPKYNDLQFSFDSDCFYFAKQKLQDFQYFPVICQCLKIFCFQNNA